MAAKRAVPEVSLGTLFLAAQLADLVWPTLVLLGVESFSIRPGITAVTPLDFTRYPYSHSLVGMAGWGIALGIAYFPWKRRRAESVILVLVVLSHWLLGLATLAVEGLLFGACVWAYVRATRAVDRTGRWSLAAFVAFLVLVYVANVFGPPPPSVAAVAWSAQAIWLLVAWGYWIDRHRIPHRAASRN